MAETKTCPKDCMLCSERQQLYCAAFMARMSLDRIEQLEEKVARLDHAGDSVFNPMAKPQEGIGGENRMPRESTIKQE